MPSTITHAYFALDVYERLDLDAKTFLYSEKQWLKTTGQGMDPTFFYHLLSIKPGKKVRDFGLFFHRHKSFLFFETLINYIKYNGYQDNPEIMTFLYGQLCHYMLDRTAHPYIIYISGQFIRGNRSTYKYNHVHGENESLIDNYLVSLRENIKPWEFRADQFCFDTHDFSDELKEVIDFTYKEVFKVPNFSKYYEQSIRDMKRFYRIFRYDKHGFKITFYKFVDLVCPKILLRKKVLSYHMKIKNKEELLNLNHERWYNPTDKRIHSTESFIDLYLRAMTEAVKAIGQINDYIYKDKKIDLRKVIKNYSYESGRDCSKKYELKHFKF